MNKLTVYKEKIELDEINNNSIISKTFDYCHLLEYKCNNNYCKSKYSKTYYHVQNENILAFELKNIVNQPNKVNPSISFEECFLNYNKIEIIICPFYKVKQLTIKRSICSLPNIFIFVMSRGKYAGYDWK